MQFIQFFCDGTLMLAIFGRWARSHQHLKLVTNTDHLQYSSQHLSSLFVFLTANELFKIRGQIHFTTMIHLIL